MPVRFKSFQFFFYWTKKHIVCKKIVPWLFIYNPDALAKTGISTGVTVANPYFLQFVNVIQYLFMNDVKIFGLYRDVKFIPVNGGFGGIIFYCEFILWGPA